MTPAEIEAKVDRDKQELTAMLQAIQVSILNALSDIKEDAAISKGEVYTSIEVIKTQLVDTRQDLCSLSGAVDVVKKKLAGNGVEGIIEKGNRLERELKDLKVSNDKVYVDVVAVKDKLSKFDTYIKVASAFSAVFGAVGLVFLGEIARGLINKVFHIG